MNISYQKPIVLERVWASYTVEEEDRSSIFNILKPLGYIYRSEYSKISPDGKTITTLEMVKQTDFENYYMTIKP